MVDAIERQLGLLVVGIVLVLAGPASAAATPGVAGVGAQLAQVRVPFIPNQGQVDVNVAYYAPTFAATLFVTKQGQLVYELPSRATDTPRRPPRSSSSPGWSLTETLVNGRARPAANGRGETNVSDFRGGDSARWRPQLPTYEQVSLGEVWPGVTVSLRAHGRSIEKLFAVRPGASVNHIRVRVGGAKSLMVNSAGALVARTGLGDVTFTAPMAYQERDGARRPVSVAYRRQGREYGFTVGAYDRSLPLVIDPLLQSTYLGGSDIDDAFALVIAPDTGDVYVAGGTRSDAFPGTEGGAQPNNAGGFDAFVARLNSGLTSLTQVTYLGGSGFDTAYVIAISPATGDVYVAGDTMSIDFPMTGGGAQSTLAGSSDTFVARLPRSLTGLTQATYLGGADRDEMYALAISPSGDIYVSGYTRSSDFPRTGGGAQSTYGGGPTDGFVARLNSGLTVLTQATYLGGSGSDHANAVVVAPATGDIYVAGDTTSTNFPGTSGGAQPNNAGNQDAVVVRLPGTLTAITRTTYLGGSRDDVVNSLALAASGDVYVAGYTNSTDLPHSAGGAQPASGGGYDAFVARLNDDLSSLAQATYLGGGDDDAALALAIAPTGNVYVAGATRSANFPGTAGGAQATIGGMIDAFVARLNTGLTTLTQATYLGGGDDDAVLALTIAATTGDIYVAGGTRSSNVPGVGGGAQPVYSGVEDAFVSRLTANLASAPPDTTIIVAAVLPLSRSVQVGGAPATAFAAIINAGSTGAANCAPAVPANPPSGLGTYVYQTTTSANVLTGTPNTPTNIAPGTTQNYVFGLSPTAAIVETSLGMRFLCDNVEAAQTPGVNNFFIVADTSPVPDTIALMSTVSGDGVVRIPDPAGIQLFAIGSSNVGATGTIVVSADTGGVALPLTLTVCETTGGSVCLTPPAPTVTVNYTAGTNRSFAFFAQASGAIPFDPGTNRVFARLRQSGVLRGATSAAVCTKPNAGC